MLGNGCSEFLVGKVRAVHQPLPERHDELDTVRDASLYFSSRALKIRDDLAVLRGVRLQIWTAEIAHQTFFGAEVMGGVGQKLIADDTLSPHERLAAGLQLPDLSTDANLAVSCAPRARTVVQRPSVRRWTGTSTRTRGLQSAEEPSPLRATRDRPLALSAVYLQKDNIQATWYRCNTWAKGRPNATTSRRVAVH